MRTVQQGSCQGRGYSVGGSKRECGGIAAMYCAVACADAGPPAACVGECPPCNRVSCCTRQLWCSGLVPAHETQQGQLPHCALLLPRCRLAPRSAAMCVYEPFYNCRSAAAGCSRLLYRAAKIPARRMPEFTVQVELGGSDDKAPKDAVELMEDVPAHKQITAEVRLRSAVPEPPCPGRLHSRLPLTLGTRGSSLHICRCSHYH